MLQNNEKLSLNKIFMETNANLGLIRKRHVVSFILQQLATRLGHPLKSKPRTKTSFINKTKYSQRTQNPPTPPKTKWAAGKDPQSTKTNSPGNPTPALRSTKRYYNK